MKCFVKDRPNREALRASQVDNLAIGCLSSNEGVARVSRVVFVSKRWEDEVRMRVIWPNLSENLKSAPIYSQ